MFITPHHCSFFIFHLCAATKNFDLCVKLKASASAHGETREYEFTGIDRVEYPSLFAFLVSKKLPVEKPEVGAGSERRKKVIVSVE